MNSFTLDCGRLSLVFAWHGDRYRQELLERDRDLDSACRLLLVSLEGTQEEAWPPSPAFQAVHIEARPGNRQAALLVGMSGSSHWSASVEADPAQSQFVFDVACRIHLPPQQLTSMYRRMEAEADAAVDLHVAAATLHPGPAPEIEARDDTIVVKAALAAPESESLPRTVRWSYSIRSRN